MGTFTPNGRFNGPFVAPTLRTLPPSVLTLIAKSANLCAKSATQLPGTIQAGTGQITSWGGTDESSLRPPASQAFSLAVLVTCGAYDQADAFYDAATATAASVRLSTSLAATHAANGGFWGGAPATSYLVNDNSNPNWQGAMWVSLAGMGAWLLWGSLSAGQQTQVTNMVTAEADRFLTYPVPYWRNKSGQIIYAGDTKGEENAWDAAVLWLAAAMQPAHGNAQTWVTKAIELTLSATATPYDVTSIRVMHGAKLRSWVSGSNLLTNGFVENHGFLFPNYMAALTQSIINGIFYAYGSGVIPAATLHNADLVYEGMVSVSFSSPPQNSPGGTVYTPGSAAIYYPGSDEGDPTRMANYSAMDALTHCTGMDRLVATSAATWAGLHWQNQVDQQNANSGARRSYWDFYHAAWALFTNYLIQNRALKVSNSAPAALLAGV